MSEATQENHAVMHNMLDSTLCLKAKFDFHIQVTNELTGEIADAVIKAARSGMSNKDIAMALLRKACEVMG